MQARDAEELCVYFHMKLHFDIAGVLSISNLLIGS